VLDIEPAKRAQDAEAASGAAALASLQQQLEDSMAQVTALQQQLQGMGGVGDRVVKLEQELQSLQGVCVCVCVRRTIMLHASTRML
jgi:hypothetical protein